MDPALQDMLLGDQEESLEALMRLRDPRRVPEAVRVVAQLGEIVSIRLARGKIKEVYADQRVESLKAPRYVNLSSGPMLATENISKDSLSYPSRPSRRGGLGHFPYTGKGVTVGIADWGIDVSHPNFIDSEGNTRFIALWDQAAPYDGVNKYGYGHIHNQEDIQEALDSDYPFELMGYHPSRGIWQETGAHGTHVLDIAAGNGRVGEAGFASEANLIAVHLSTGLIGEGLSLGDSVRVFEALDFLTQTRPYQPLVINLSVGNHGDAHLGKTLIEQGIDYLLAERSDRAIVQSTGNYYGARAHSSGKLPQNGRHRLYWLVDRADVTRNELEVFYEGTDRIEARLYPPEQSNYFSSVPQNNCEITDSHGRLIGKIYHRLNEPNSGKNHIDIFLYPEAPPGEWTLELHGLAIHNGSYHAWIERDGGCRSCQSRFALENVDPQTTTGTICNGFYSIAVGAYDPYKEGYPIAPFSSSGPTADGRQKPDLLAPGVRILAAKSASLKEDRSSGALTYKTGTSMAAPHVAGYLAMKLEENPNLFLDSHRLSHIPISPHSTSKGTTSHRMGRGRFSPHIESLTYNPNRKNSFNSYLMENSASSILLQTLENHGQSLDAAQYELLNEQIHELFQNPKAVEKLPLFSLIGRPGQRLSEPLKEGDILLHMGEGKHIFQFGIMESEEKGWEESFFQNESIWARVFPSEQSSNFLETAQRRKITKTGGYLPYSQAVLRYESLLPNTPHTDNLEDLKQATLNARNLKRNAGSNQISRLYAQVSQKTGLRHPGLPNNPLVGVQNDMLLAAYNAHHFHGAISPPHVLLAIWVKEGGAQNHGALKADGAAGINASNASRAKSIFRSMLYYEEMGMDLFLDFIPQRGTDNKPRAFDNTGAPKHQRAFEAQIERLVQEGFLSRNISADIDSHLNAQGLGNGRFKIVPTNHFYIYSLLLMDALFRDFEAQAKGIMGISSQPDLGMSYLCWNMGAGKFRTFFNSMEGHRQKPQNQVDGKTLSLLDWTFGTKPREGEWAGPRENAIKLRFFAQVFEVVFSGTAPAPPTPTLPTPPSPTEDYPHYLESGTSPDWPRFKQILAKVAKDEESLWTKSDGKKRIEKELVVRPYLEKYWKPLLPTNYVNQAKKSSEPGARAPWSAAFISWCLLEAQRLARGEFGQKFSVKNYGFQKAQKHIVYIVKALRNREAVDTNTHFWLYRPQNDPLNPSIEVGDLVCLNRSSSGHSYENLRSTYWDDALNKPSSIKPYGVSHCDIVVEKKELYEKPDKSDKKTYLITVGGNVPMLEEKPSNTFKINDRGTVGKKYFELDGNGQISKLYFMKVDASGKILQKKLYADPPNVFAILKIRTPTDITAPSTPSENLRQKNKEILSRFVDRYSHIVFSDSQEINEFFDRFSPYEGFCEWFQQKISQKGFWRGRGIPKKNFEATKANFNRVWDHIPLMFYGNHAPAQINILQFLALVSIMINETGRFVPISEFGSLDHMFNRIPQKGKKKPKQSYNTHASNRSAYELFRNQGFLEAHKDLPLYNRVRNTTNTMWDGDSYPTGFPVDPNQAGIIAEADFYKFRGRGLIQTTLRGNYTRLIRFIRSYRGSDPTIIKYRERWAGERNIQQIASKSRNSDWDELFMTPNGVFAYLAVYVFQHRRNDFLELSKDKDILMGTGPGSLYYVGWRVAGNKSYGRKLKNRVIQMLEQILNEPPTPPVAYA